jgi:hypothetical protein
LDGGGHARTYRARLGDAAMPLPHEGTPRTLWSGRTDGPVAWQPPQSQDEDLVPLTAGVLLRHSEASHRSSAQTLGPESLLRPQDGSGPEGNLRACWGVLGLTPKVRPTTSRARPRSVVPGEVGYPPCAPRERPMSMLVNGSLALQLVSQPNPGSTAQFISRQLPHAVHSTANQPPTSAPARTDGRPRRVLRSTRNRPRPAVRRGAADRTRSSAASNRPGDAPAAVALRAPISAGC